MCLLNYTLFFKIMPIFFNRCFSHPAVNNKAHTPFVASEIVIICWGSLKFSVAVDLLSFFTPLRPHVETVYYLFVDAPDVFEYFDGPILNLCSLYSVVYCNTKNAY